MKKVLSRSILNRCQWNSKNMVANEFSALSNRSGLDCYVQKLEDDTFYHSYVYGYYIIVPGTKELV